MLGRWADTCSPASVHIPGSKRSLVVGTCSFWLPHAESTVCMCEDIVHAFVRIVLFRIAAQSCSGTLPEFLLTIGNMSGASKSPEGPRSLGGGGAAAPGRTGRNSCRKLGEHCAARHRSFFPGMPCFFCWLSATEAPSTNADSLPGHPERVPRKLSLKHDTCCAKYKHAHPVFGSAYNGAG